MSRRKPHVPATTSAKPPVMWRSLEAREQSEEERVRAAAAEMDGGFILADSLKVGRRGFLGAATATAAASALAACESNVLRRPRENILPYTQAPEHVVPGVPLHFATVTERLGDALGLLVTSHEGRPTKIDGNPRHPSTAGGASDAIAQAALMDLYDPDRSRSPARHGDGGFEDATWADLEEALRARLATHDRDSGEGLAVLARPSISPTFLRARTAFLARFPRARFHTWASVSDANVLEGARLAFGRPLHTHCDYRSARVILSLDADFLLTEPGAVLASRRFADGRRIMTPADEPSRLYVVEPGLSVTGAAADHRLRLPGSHVGRYALALARALAARRVDFGSLMPLLARASSDGIPEPWLDAVVDDLLAHRAATVITVGLRQPAWVHALGHVINAALGNAGATVAYSRTAFDVAPEEAPPSIPVDHPAELASLAEGLSSVRTLLVLGANPVYDAPADLGLADKIAGVDTSFHLGTHRDETAGVCTWHAPEAHPLETWGDAAARDGTVAIQQPLIAPLWGGRSAIELLGLAAGEPHWRGYSMVRRTVRSQTGGAGLERVWRQALHTGIISGTTRRPEPPPSITDTVVAEAITAAAPAPELSADALEVAFAPCPKMQDGRSANNLWLQELPENLTKLVWDNAALISPATARELGVASRDLVRISREGAGDVEIGVWVMPGHADRSITLPLGWGRTQAGRYGNGKGFDVHPLRTTDALWFAGGARVERTGRRALLVVTQDHGDMEGRPVSIDATLAEYREEPTFPQFRSVEMDTPPLWDRVDYENGHRWGMSIDLNACTGCNACIVACQAENNIPVVGKGQVARGREMYWMRLDRYFVGEDENDPQIALQPMACQQCEEAPCENVCPVNATAHSPEGLNDMAYNRCIGTRYCANNCPYKARRFNYLPFHAYIEDPQGWTADSPSVGVTSSIPETRQMAYNPNVTVRMRGVMEKCTYCVQRIQEAKIASRREDRPISDGDLKTACQEVCPTQAIVFGDLNGYPFVVRNGSRLVGKSNRELEQELGLRAVRITREEVPEQPGMIATRQERGTTTEVERIEGGADFESGRVRYVVHSATRLPDLAARDRHYKLLAEVGTHPRTTFLARIRNPNDAMRTGPAEREEAEG